MRPARRLARVAVMPPTRTTPQWIARLLGEQSGVLTQAAASAWLGQAAVRWRLETGRWQRPCHGIVVTHSGPLTHAQRLWAAVLACGGGAALAGLTAARLDGLSGFPDERIYLLVPAHRRVRSPLPEAVVRRTRAMGDGDVHPVRRPPRTRTARSLLDAAAWMANEDGARAVLAAGVQQRLIRAEDLARALAGRPTLARRALIGATLADIAGGAEALSELDFLRLVRRFRIPEPDRQVVRLDAAGRRRWLDACWEQARLIVEIDGLWHMEATAWWADMRRDNEFTAGGWRVLRFPAFVLREHPELVAAQVMAALALAPAG